MNRAVLAIMMLAAIQVTASGESAAPTPKPTGVVFHRDTLYRTDARGDNWCLTWAVDDSLLTAMCDGNWMGGKASFHNHLYRITGGPDGFTREPVEGYPASPGSKGSWFGYGLVAVDGSVYVTISKTPANQWSGPFRGIKLLKSVDNGATWTRVDRNGEDRLIAAGDDAKNEVNQEEMFFLEEYGLAHDKQQAYPFSFLDFVQRGKDHGASRDGYVYIYSPEGAHAHRLLLARVRKEQLGERSAWEYFARYEGGEPVWTSNIGERGAAHEFPEKSSEGHYFGWYSWLPSVVWNEGLGLYIMVNGGTYGGRGMTSSDKDYYDDWMHTRTGSLGFWYSNNPHGPWTEFYYEEYWTVDDPGNLTYQPKLSPKWISPDGREMVLIWSDAMRNEAGHSHTTNYKWNQMKISIETKVP